MSLKSRIKAQLQKTDFGTRLISDRRFGVETKAVINLIINLLFAMYNGALGLASSSVWFIAVCVYYVILAVMRFAAVLNLRKNTFDRERLALAMTGVMLLVLGLTLAGINYLSGSMRIASQFDVITMITIATYTFYKIAMAVIRAVKDKKNPSPIVFAIHGIGYAEVAVSLLNMQRSMLVTFDGMSEKEITIFNAATGMAVFLFILSLGVIMIKKSVIEKGE